MNPIQLTPRATEKAYAKSEAGVYTFSVSANANKGQIAKAVSTQFGVKVERVTTVVQKGKAMRFTRGKNRYPGTTKRADTKKAYVKLVAGEKINLYETEKPVEEEKK